MGAELCWTFSSWLS